MSHIPYEESLRDDDVEGMSLVQLVIAQGDLETLLRTIDEHDKLGAMEELQWANERLEEVRTAIGERIEKKRKEEIRALKEQVEELKSKEEKRKEVEARLSALEAE